MIGEILKAWRISQSLSAFELAKLVNVTPQTIYNTEKGITVNSKYLIYYLENSKGENNNEISGKNIREF